MASGASRNLARGVAVRDELFATLDRVSRHPWHGRTSVRHFLCGEVLGDLVHVLGAELAHGVFHRAVLAQAVLEILQLTGQITGRLAGQARKEPTLWGNFAVYAVTGRA